MANTSKEYKLAIKIAGKVDSSLNSAVGQAQSALSRLGSFAGTMAKAAAVALGAATTAAVAFAKSAVDAGMQFDSAMSQVAATMGTTVDQIGELRDFAMEMGSKTAFSATEAAEALNYMALAGYDANTSMAMLPNVLNLAAAGSMELASASDMITDAQSALGLSLEDTTAMVDQMAKASSKTNTSVAQLGEAILTVGGTAQYMSGGTAELNSVLGVLADNGIKGSEGGTHLRNMLLKLASPTTDATKLLNRLGVDIFDAEGNMRSFTEVFPELNAAMADFTDQERLDAMSTLFNSRDIASATALLSTTTERWEELGAAITDSAGAAEAMANTQLDNLAGDITLFKSALEGAQITLSDQLTPTLRQFVQFGTNGISQLSEAFQEGGLSGAMDAFGSILSDGLNMVIAALPEMVDAGMQLLGALGDGIMANLPMILDAFLQISLMAIDGVVDALPRILEAGVQVVTTLAFGIADALPELIPSVVDAVIQIAQTLTNPESFEQIITAALAIIEALGRGLIDALPELIAALPEIITSIVDALTGATPLIIETGIELFVALVANLPAIIAGIVQAVPQIIAAILNAFGTLASDLAGVFSGAWEAVKEVFAPVGEFFSGVWQSIKDTFAPVGEFFTGLWNSVVNAYHTVIDPWIEIVRRLAALINDEVIEPIKQWFSELWNRIVEIFTPAAEFFSGVWSGIQGAFGSIVDWFSGVFTDAWQAVKDVFSTGGAIFVGIVDGILEGFKTVVNGIIGGLNRVIKVPFDGINSALATIKGINILGVAPFDWVQPIGIPQIPMLAEGGVVSQPTILEAGEAGSEAIIPLGELWAQLQDMISDNIGGVADRISDILAELDGGGGSDDGPEPESGDGPVYQITYRPEYHFEGAAPSRDDMVEAERMSQDEFNRKMAQWVKDNDRKRF